MSIKLMSLIVVCVYLFLQRGNIAISISDNSTIKGKDLNSNSIRDDVDEWISEQDVRESVKKAMKQYAVVFQKIHIKDFSIKKFSDSISQYDNARNCLSMVLFNSKERTDRLRTMHRIGYVNVKKMRKNYFKIVDQDTKAFVSKQKSLGKKPPYYYDFSKTPKPRDLKIYDDADRELNSLSEQNTKLKEKLDEVINNTVARRKLFYKFGRSRKSGLYVSPSSTLEVCDFIPDVETIVGESIGFGEKDKAIFNQILSGNNKVLWCQYEGRNYSEDNVSKNLKYKDISPFVTKVNESCFEVEFLSIYHFRNIKFTRTSEFYNDGVLVRDYNEFQKVKK